MAETKTFRAGVFSVVKHCYLPRAVAAQERIGPLLARQAQLAHPLALGAAPDGVGGQP